MNVCGCKLSAKGFIAFANEQKLDDLQYYYF